MDVPFFLAWPFPVASKNDFLSVRNDQMVTINRIFLGVERRQTLAVAVTLAVLAAGLACWPSTSLADPPPYNASETFSVLGWGQNALADTYDLGPALANQACGPVAATYGLIYLQNTYPASYGTKLAGSQWDDWSLTADTLAGPDYMNTTVTDGTMSGNFASGLTTYINKATTRYLLPPITMTSIILTYQDGQWGSIPGWYDIYTNLRDQQAVQIQIRYKDPTTGNNVGHYLLVTGISWEASYSLCGSVTVYDPANHTSLPPLYVEVDAATGILTTTYDGTTAAIVAEYEESPIPEPATLSLLALGGLALVRRRRG